MWIFNRVHRADIQLKKLETWVNKKGFLLIKGKQKHIIDQIFMDKKIIFLSTRQKPINQLFSFLHEAGHLLIRIDNKKFVKEFPTLSSLEDKEGIKKPLRYYAEEVYEEQVAWKNGEKIAEELKIPLDVNAYYKYASRFLLQYMAMATCDRKWLIK